jgi:hypothetical protein
VAVFEIPLRKAFYLTLVEFIGIKRSSKVWSMLRLG